MNLKPERKILAQAVQLLGDVKPEAKAVTGHTRPAEPSDTCRAVNRLSGSSKELPPFSITSSEEVVTQICMSSSYHGGLHYKKIILPLLPYFSSISF